MPITEKKVPLDWNPSLIIDMTNTDLTKKNNIKEGICLKYAYWCDKIMVNNQIKEYST